MSKYVKKPIPVDAHQITENDFIHNSKENKELPVWIKLAMNKDHNEPGALYIKDGKCVCNTLEGSYITEWGDYIIKGVVGEIYPCKQSIFIATYEKVPLNDIILEFKS